MAELREAVLACHEVRLVYRRRDTGTLSYPILHPYGFLTGSRAYLVGFISPSQGPGVPPLRDRQHRAAAPDRRELRARRDLRPLSLRGPLLRRVLDKKVFDVLWRFSPAVAADARSFRFHPQQQVNTGNDGRVTVAFRASGLTEMAWHLFTWGEHVEILAPEALKERYRACLSVAGRAVGGPTQPAESITS